MRGANYGALLGWLYDKCNKKKDEDLVKRMAYGALIGSLAGAGYSQYKSAEAGTEKSAQTWGYFAPAHDPVESARFHGKTIPGDSGLNAKVDVPGSPDDWSGYTWSTLGRGAAKGLHNTLPGIADFVGMAAGALNGADHAVTGLFTDGLSWDKFKNNFSNGYRGPTKFVKDYVSDPLRYAQMYYGGSKIKKSLDDKAGMHIKRILDAAGPASDEYGNANKRYWEAVRQKDGVQSLGKFVEGTTEVAAGWPVAGAAIGRIGKWMKPVAEALSYAKGKAIPRAAASTAKSIASSAGNWVAKETPTLSKAVSGAGKFIGPLVTKPLPVSATFGANMAKDELAERNDRRGVMTEGLNWYKSQLGIARDLYDKAYYETDPAKKSELMEVAKRIIEENQRIRLMSQLNGGWGQYIPMVL